MYSDYWQRSFRSGPNKSIGNKDITFITYFNKVIKQSKINIQ